MPREGARRPACTHGAGDGPGRGPCRVLWGFKVAKISSINGIYPRRARAREDLATPTIRCFDCFALLLYYTALPSSPQALYIAIDSHVTTAVPHEDLPFVTATGRTFARVCMPCFLSIEETFLEESYSKLTRMYVCCQARVSFWKIHTGH